jgi:hypothetical protein
VQLIGFYYNNVICMRHSIIFVYPQLRRSVLHSVSLFCNLYVVDLFTFPSCQVLFKNSKEHNVSLPSTSHVKNIHETSNKGADSDSSSTSSPKKGSTCPANSNPVSKIKVCMMYCL